MAEGGYFLKEDTQYLVYFLIIIADAFFKIFLTLLYDYL